MKFLVFMHLVIVIHTLKNGQWTVSIKARPFHNLALDEAHECIVNRKLKQITIPLVELADFMAYLDSVMSGIEMCISFPQKHGLPQEKEH